MKIMQRLRRIVNMSYAFWAPRTKFSTKPERGTFAQRKEIYGDSFPDKMLHTKHKTPQAMYLADANTADFIIKSLEPHLANIKYRTAFILNPGTGIMARLLLDRKELFDEVVLVESTDHFLPYLHTIQEQYSSRAKVKSGDIINIWKLSFQDKMDNGNRVQELLIDVPRRAHNDEPNMMLFGIVGCYSFFKHLTTSLVFQHSLLSMGRCEMFFVMPPPIYIHLTCSNEIGYMIYRSNSMLFQIFFEYQFIARVPRNHFLPFQTEFNLTKNKKLGRLISIDPEYLYLVKIVPRRNLFDLCAAADLPALWYFVRQNCVSRRNRVIPNLEKWIPCCGPRLIINTETPEPVVPMFPDVTNLPMYSQPCTTMTCRDFFPWINIYTQFGDLTPSQMLTLFTQFRSWPEYGDSSFLASLENNLLKMEAAAEDDIGNVEEDDISNELIEVTAEANEQNNKKTKSTSKRKLMSD